MGDTMTIEMRGITKSFGETVANDGVDFTVGPGEIHVLLGENGAGKTTLMNILFGHVLADDGAILVDGQEVEIAAPNDAIAHGIGMVHQHFSLVPSFTVAENVMLGPELQYGRRENFDDGFESDDFRIQFSAKYNFSHQLGGD